MEGEKVEILKNTAGLVLASINQQPEYIFYLYALIQTKDAAWYFLKGGFLLPPVALLLHCCVSE